MDDFYLGGVRQTTWTADGVTRRLGTFPEGGKWVVQLMAKDEKGWRLDERHEFLTFAEAVDKHDQMIDAVKTEAWRLVRRGVLLALTSIVTGLSIASAVMSDGLTQWMFTLTALATGVTAFVLQWSDPD